MFCPQCGNELWAGDKYCSKCGTPTRQNLEKEPETQIGNVVDKEPTEKTDASVKETDASIKVDQPSRDTSAMESMVTTDVPVDGNTIPLKEPPDPTGKLRLDFPDGSSYFGYTLNGQPHSTGVMWYADNSVYEGEFEYGKRSGIGTLTT